MPLASKNGADLIMSHTSYHRKIDEIYQVIALLIKKNYHQKFTLSNYFYFLENSKFSIKDDVPEGRPLYLDAQATTPLVNMNFLISNIENICLQLNFS